MNKILSNHCVIQTVTCAIKQMPYLTEYLTWSQLLHLQFTFLRQHRFLSCNNFLSLLNLLKVCA